MVARRLKAYPVYLYMAVMWSFSSAVMYTLNIVYQIETVKLSPLQLVLVGTTLEAVCFISQIPTGVIADAYSRRISVIIGYLMIGIGFLVEGLIPRFEAVLIAQVIWGIGSTFVDGALEAWITGEVGDEHAARIFTRSTQIGLVAELVGIPVAIALGSLRLNLPVVVGAGILVLFALSLIFLMPDN